MKKILLLVFHPRLESSKVNKHLLSELSSKEFVNVKDMYELYPDFNIDVAQEQQNLIDADLVIMQHPFFWYAAPPLTKQWIDLVLEYGWAYGIGGDKLQGKRILHIISSGGTFEAYSRTGKNLYTYLELLRPFELTYRLCQMKLLPPYIIPGSNHLTETEIVKHCTQIADILEKMSSSQSDDFLNGAVQYLNELT